MALGALAFDAEGLAAAMAGAAGFPLPHLLHSNGLVLIGSEVKPGMALFAGESDLAYVVKSLASTISHRVQPVEL